MNKPPDLEQTAPSDGTATVSSTESAPQSTPARSSAVPELSAVGRTPTFRPPLRRLSTGTPLSKVNAAFKSPIRTDTSQPSATTTTGSESTDRLTGRRDALKAELPGRRLTAANRPSPYRRTPTQSRTIHSSREAASSQRETLEDITGEVAQLRQQLKDVESEIAELSKDYCEDELQQYIDHLHEYNEMKDVGQLLLGKMAEVQGTTIAEIYRQFDLNLDD